jgi:hypothetical protein
MVWSGCTTPSITMLDFFPVIAVLASDYRNSINGRSIFYRPPHTYRVKAPVVDKVMYQRSAVN